MMVKQGAMIVVSVMMRNVGAMWIAISGVHQKAGWTEPGQMGEGGGQLEQMSRYIIRALYYTLASGLSSLD